MNLKYAKQILDKTIKDGLLSEIEIEALYFIISKIENPISSDSSSLIQRNHTASIFDGLTSRISSCGNCIFHSREKTASNTYQNICTRNHGVILDIYNPCEHFIDKYKTCLYCKHLVRHSDDKELYNLCDLSNQEISFGDTCEQFERKIP